MSLPQEIDQRRHVWPVGATGRADHANGGALQPILRLLLDPPASAAPLYRRPAPAANEPEPQVAS
jgi:hypothetical protein